MTVLVSPMLITEAARTAELVREVITPLEYYSAEARASEVSKYTPEKLKELVREDPLSVILARSGSNLAGFCISRFDDGIIWLAWFGVHEEWRRLSVGELLLSALDDAANARGCHKIWCDTRTDNEKSQRALRRAGYSLICSVSRHWYAQDFYLWEKFVELKQ